MIQQNFLDFLNSAKSPFHVAKNLANLLQDAEKLKEKELWSLKGKTYYSIRGNSAIIGLSIPQKTSSIKRIQVISSHLDSPSLKLKPHWSKKYGYYIWRVAPYGGIYSSTWFNRDLSIAGRINFINSQGKLGTELVDIKDKKFIIPHLAIHLDRDTEGKNLVINKGEHLNIILGLENMDEENCQKFLSSQLSQKIKKILSFDLFLYDTQKACFGGLNDEFIYSSKLDNLAMAHSSFYALNEIDYCPEDSLALVVAFNHEEVGSTSNTGANSQFLSQFIERILLSLGYNRHDILKIFSQSHNISADMAHAIHPNYPEKHDSELYTSLGKGIALKENANQRYASTSNNLAEIIHLCEKHKIDYQYFINKIDIACGSTIGPSVSSQLAMNTVDLGAPMLSMHSIRELMHKKDYNSCYKLFLKFLSRG